MILKDSKTFREKFGTRDVIHSWADGKGGQRVEAIGALTKKRMKDIDYEFLAKAKPCIKELHDAEKPSFTWWHATPMHFRTYVKRDKRNSRNDEYTDGMIEHDMPVGELLNLLDALGITENTIVMCSKDNGPHYNTWPDAGTTPFHKDKNGNWVAAYRVPAFVRWPGHFPTDVTLNGIVAHEDWLPTFAAAAGDTDIKERLLKGTTINGRTYKNHLDGYNQLDYLSGKVKASPKGGRIYVNDAGSIAALRYGDWKATILENSASKLQIGLEPFVELRAPLLGNLRRDPFEKAYEGSNTYYDWYIDRAYILTSIQPYTFNFLSTFKDYKPSKRLEIKVYQKLKSKLKISQLKVIKS
jgi:arylsulfatase